MIDEREIRSFFYNDPSLSDVHNLLDKSPGLLNYKFEKGRQEFNLLSLAVLNFREDILAMLFEGGAKPVECDDYCKNLIYVLLSQCRQGSRKSGTAIEVLRVLRRHGVGFPVEDRESCSDLVRFNLFGSISKCGASLFHELIRLGFKPAEVERIANLSMIDAGISARSSEVDKILDDLVSLGCSVNQVGINSCSSPVSAALENQRYDFAAKLLDAGGAIHSPLKAAFLLARWNGVPAPILDRIIDENNISPPENSYGEVPLHIAIQSRNLDFISYIVNRGADINYRSKEYGSPLAYAISLKCKEEINLLIALGANINAIDDNKRTPLDLAQSMAGTKQICALLVKHGAKTRLELAGVQGSLDGMHEAIRRAISPRHIWAERALGYLLKTGKEEAEAWHALIRHCLENDSAKPTEKWSKEANRIITSLKGVDVRACIIDWMQFVPHGRSQQGIADDEECYSETSRLSVESNMRLMKGLIWLASRYSDDEMSRALRDLATEMYKKVPGIGMRNAKLANAALYSLSVMPEDAGIKEIISLRSGTKYNPALVNINRVFDRIAKERGVTPDELAEKMVPDYGLSDVGIFTKDFGNCEAKIRIFSPGSCELIWSVDGKVRASAPADVARDNADDVKSIKALLKDLKFASSAHCHRIEQKYLRKGSIDFHVWMEQYINHKLIGVLARKLIWRVDDGSSVVDVIYLDGVFSDSSGAEVNINPSSHVMLWHPIMSDPQSVISWRKFLIDREITQPFKQAHREIYILTDAERQTASYSLRFSNHILKMSQFHALATQRGWKQNRGGHWDGGNENSATKDIPASGVSAYFHAEGVDSYGFGSGGMYECVATERLIFLVDGEDVKLESVDPLVRSEIMRDIDLFVGVAGVANDPDWRDRNVTYWDRASFGELSETASTRADVLKGIIPKLAISEKLSLDGKWLVVRGSLASYKIHLGSSNIRIASNDAYLCIVEKISRDNFKLPFAGDHTLSLIISKAALLANDHKIKDETILSQISASK